MSTEFEDEQRDAHAAMVGRVTGIPVKPAIQVSWGVQSTQSAVLHGKAAKIIAECAATDEPLFVFRGKDLLAIFALVEYMEQVEKLGPADHEMQMGIANAIMEFKAWQHVHRDQVRYPD